MGKPRKVIPDWRSIEGLADMGFDEPATRYRVAKEYVDKYEQQRKSVSAELEVYLKAVGVTEVMYEGLVCSVRNGGQASIIDATRLLELGVDADVIAAATVPGGKYTYFEMRDPAKQKDNRKHKSNEEGDDGE